MDRNLQESYYWGAADAEHDDNPSLPYTFGSVESARQRELRDEGYPEPYVRAHANAYARGWFGWPKVG